MLMSRGDTAQKRPARLDEMGLNFEGGKAMRKLFTACTTAALALVCALLLTSTAKAQVSGAIFTTTAGGTTVNGNLYSSLANVYLNGGPQNGACTPASAGLTPGTYYFQVTDPSGGTVLDTDAASNRIVTIGSDGLLDGYTGTHAFTSGKCTGTDASNISVALCVDTGANILCNNTTNAGGEYKAWLIATSAATVNGDGITLTFPNSAAKTDNFKAPPTPPSGCPDPTNPACTPGPPPTVDLIGFKFYDANATGVFDGTVTAGIPESAGTVAFTGKDTPIDNWLIGMNPASNFNVATQSAGSGSEPGASCALTGGLLGEFDFTVLADQSITYIFSESHPVVLKNGSYVPDSTWFQTAPPPVPPGTGTETDSSSAMQTPVGFGNLCVGAGGGLTLGFWSNSNGEAVLTGSKTGKTISFGYLTLINTSYLRNANGTIYTDGTGSFSNFSSYLLNANATNMAYMLSAQYITMALNVAHGNVSGTSLVYCPGCSGANSNGFITTSGLLSEVETQLAYCGTSTLGFSPCVVGSSSPLRTYWQALETALDNANNNKTFVQPNANSCSFQFDPAVVNACTF